jgi:hypothetical protein
VWLGWWGRDDDESGDSGKSVEGLWTLVVIPVPDRGSTAGSRHPSERPKLGAERRDQVGRVLRVIGLDEMVVVVGWLGVWRGHDDAFRCVTRSVEKFSKQPQKPSSVSMAPRALSLHSE